MIDPRRDEEIDRTGLAALVARSTGQQRQSSSSSTASNASSAANDSNASTAEVWTNTSPPGGVVTDPQPTPVGGVPIVEGLPPMRAHPWRSRILRTVALLLVAGVVYYGVSLFQVWTVGRSDQARPVDAIVVMGAAQYDGTPSPQLAARLDHVVSLWDDGLAAVVVVTGGNLPGDRFTEASASAAYLEDRGVPAEAILQEHVSHNSYDSIVGVRDLLRARGLSSVLLVSDPFHSLRIRLIAQELGLTAYVSPTRSSPVQGRAAYVREAKEAAGIAVGRIIGFRRLLSITG